LTLTGAWRDACGRQTAQASCLAWRWGNKVEIAVIGAGLQGLGIAFEAADRGARVTVYEKAPTPISGASAQNEGKIHLGFVYAHDASLATARQMVRGALAFEPALRRWLGAAVDVIPVSSPFTYLVHRDSLETPDAVEAHFRHCTALAREMTGGAPAACFGADLHEPTRRLSKAELETAFNPALVTAAFTTPEIAIDPAALARLMTERAAATPRLMLETATRITAVADTPQGLLVTGEQGGHPFTRRFDHVINAAWDGRLALDATMNLAPRRDWLWRIKHYLRVRLPNPPTRLPSATIVLGRFGDIVDYRSGDIFLSWYPVGLRGMDKGLAPPAWPQPPALADQAIMRKGIVDALATLVPSVLDLPVDAIDVAAIEGGLIFAWGATDVDDPASELHLRAEIGPHWHGAYCSVDTGKYTTAPAFALDVADNLLPRMTRGWQGVTEVAS
jgi:glycine/D-amino acid oxidase-like deaminating enzyme